MDIRHGREWIVGFGAVARLSLDRNRGDGRERLTVLPRADRPANGRDHFGELFKEP